MMRPHRDALVDLLAETAGSEHAVVLVKELRGNLDVLFAWLEEEHVVCRTNFVYVAGRQARNYGITPNAATSGSVSTIDKAPHGKQLWTVRT